MEKLLKRQSKFVQNTKQLYNTILKQPSISSIFSPFMPAVLNRTNIIQQKNKVQLEPELNTREAGQIHIYDTIQGLSDYFKGSTIKQKICHPLFIAIKFAKTIKLYFQSDLQPKVKEDEDRLQYQAELFINIHKYFIESISCKQNNQKKIALKIKHSQNKGMDDKVRMNLERKALMYYQFLYKQQQVKGFLQSIYSEIVQFLNSDEENLENFILYKSDNLINMQLAYKIAYPQLEMMLINQHNFDMIQNQLRYYNQDIISERDASSENLYYIPKLEVTLNRDFVSSDKRIFLPVKCSQICESSLEKQVSINQKVNKTIKTHQKKELQKNMLTKSNSSSETSYSNQKNNQKLNEKKNHKLYDFDNSSEKKCQPKMSSDIKNPPKLNKIEKKIEFFDSAQDQVGEDKIYKKQCTQNQVKQENFVVKQQCDEQQQSQTVNFVKKEESNYQNYNSKTNNNHDNDFKKVHSNKKQNTNFNSDSPRFFKSYVKQADSAQNCNCEFVETTDVKELNKKYTTSNDPINKEQIKIEKHNDYQNDETSKQNSHFQQNQNENQQDIHYGYPEHREYDYMAYQANDSPQQEAYNAQYSYANSPNSFPYYQPMQYPGSMHMVMPNRQYQYVQILPQPQIGMQPMYYQPIPQNYQRVNNPPPPPANRSNINY